jgi:hypothetical protein
MRRQFLMGAGALAFAALTAPLAQAQQGRPQRWDEPYGRDMMSAREREAYRERIHAAQTEEERERIRAQHQNRMESRANIRGARHGQGGGMGQGGGRSQGAGQGGGMGQGGAMRPRPGGGMGRGNP